MRTFTLDTSAVIAGSNDEPVGQYVDGLIQLAREGIVDLAVTTAFVYDQRKASSERQEVNLCYLSQDPVVTIPGIFTFDVSAFDQDVFVSDDTLMEQVKAILTAGKQASRDGQVHDVHHLVAHRLASRDAFVTSDHDDMARPAIRDRLQREVGIVVMTPAEALRLALTADE